MKLIRLQVSNYRTLEQVEITFDRVYSAVCGQNDAGKTNVVRALRHVLGSQSPQLPFWESTDVNIKSDWPKRLSSELESAAAAIGFGVCLEIEPERDRALSNYFTRKFQVTGDAQPHQVGIVLKYPANSTRTAEVTAFGKTVSGPDATDILEKVQGLSALYVHNSTEAIMPHPFRGQFGRLRELVAMKEGDLRSLESEVSKKLKKLAKSGQAQITDFLGRLGRKYEVQLSVPNLSFDQVPIALSIAQGAGDVPLTEWGSGTINRTLIFLLLLGASQRGASGREEERLAPVIILEEPESFLHPEAQAQFGAVIQSLAAELNVQVIATTHSPYMMSTASQSANVLLERKDRYKQQVATTVVDTQGEHWMKPFAQALGMSAGIFEPWKELFHSDSPQVLLVEGATDKAVFEFMRRECHGSNRLAFDGEVVEYGGVGALVNASLLKLLKRRHSRIVVTFDLDAKSEAAKCLESIGLKADRDFLSIGVEKDGRKCLEGILPERIKHAVNAANGELTDAAIHGKGDSAKSARNRLKQLYVEMLRTDQDFQSGYDQLHACCKKLNAIFAAQ